MAIIKLSVKSLKTDFLKSLFYFMAFALTTIFIFSFFNLTFHPDAGIHLGKGDSSLLTTIATIVIVVAMMCVFLANDYYVGNKSLDISVMLMSGASVYKTGFYIFFQSAIVMALAIPTGIVISYGLLPILNIAFQNLFNNNQTVFFISKEAVLATSIILLFEIGWCTLLNIGYCYRSSVHTLIRSSSKIDWQGLGGRNRSTITYLFFYLIPFVLFIVNEDVMGFLMISMLGSIGVYGFIRQVFPTVITKMQSNRSLEKPKQLILLGFYKYNLQKSSVLVLTMLFSSLLLMSMIIYHVEVPLISMITLLSYGSVMVLLSLTILFKMAMQFKQRKRNFLHLHYSGFTRQDLKSIMNQEMLLFYATLIVIPLLYQICILGKLLYLQMIAFTLAILIVIIQIVPSVISCIICVILYHKMLPK